jgi:hypothetical protein
VIRKQKGPPPATPSPKLANSTRASLFTPLAAAHRASSVDHRAVPPLWPGEFAYRQGGHRGVHDGYHGRGERRGALSRPFTNGATPLSDTPTLSNYSAFTHGSRREAAEHYDVSASTAVIWVKCFRETGRCAAKTPMRTFLDAMPMTKEKMIAA